MKRLFYCILFAACGLPGIAQTPVSTNEDTLSVQEQRPDSIWDEAITNKGLDFNVFGKYARNDRYFNQLREQFEQGTPALQASDVYILYYGYAYRDSYTGGYTTSPGCKLFKTGDYAQAYQTLIAELQKNPASPVLLLHAIRSGRQINRPTEEIAPFYRRLISILETIESSGDGTKESPFIVLSVPDEYIFMQFQRNMKQFKSQELVQEGKRSWDRLIVFCENDGIITEEELWFDVSFPVIEYKNPNYWAKRLKNKNEKN